VVQEDGTEIVVTNPSDWPDGKAQAIFEPIVKTTVIAPSEFVGTIMELCQTKRGTLLGMDYLSEDRVELRYNIPLAEIIFDFFDTLKSRTRGYASLDYEEAGEQISDLVKVDILLQGETVDAFSAIVHKDAAYGYGNRMATSNICRLMISRILATTARPRYWDWLRCTMIDSASTFSPLSRMSTLTTSDARNSLKA
jgi:GTP-binding protein LepA